MRSSPLTLFAVLACASPLFCASPSRHSASVDSLIRPGPPLQDLLDSLQRATDVFNPARDYHGDGGPLPERSHSTRWELDIDHFYASDPNALALDRGLYSDIRLNNRSTVLGLPLRVSGGLVLQNNRVNGRLSSLSVEFDYAALLRSYREKMQDAVLRESYENLPAGQQQLLQNRHRAELCRKLLQSPEYRRARQNLSERIDSLGQNLCDRRDSVELEHLTQLREHAKALEQRTDSAYNADLQQFEKTEAALNAWRTKAAVLQQDLDERIRTGSFAALERKYGLRQKGQVLLTSLRNLRLGSQQVSNGPFDVASIPVQGVGLELYRRGGYVALQYGKENRAPHTAPDSRYRSRAYTGGRRVLHAKAGLGLPETDHLHVACSVVQAEAGAGSPDFSRRSAVLSIDARYFVGAGFFLDAAGSAANADQTGTSGGGDLLRGIYRDLRTGSGHKLAALLRVGWRAKTGASEWSVGCQSVGDQFESLGNPFLLKNRKTLRMEGKQQLLRRRLQVKGSILYAGPAAGTEVLPGIRQWQYSGDLSYRFGARGSRLWGSYQPGFYTQEAPGSAKTLYRMNLASAGLHLLCRPGKRGGQWASMFQVTNYRDQTRFGDTLTLSGLWYGMFLQSYSSPRYALHFLSSVGLDGQNPGVCKDFTEELSQVFYFKNGQITQGLQVLKRFYDGGLFAGGSAGVQWKFGRGLRLGLHATCLRALSAPMQDQYSVHAGAGWQF